MEELKNLENENDVLEEGRFKKWLASLGLAAATAFGAPSSAQAAQPSAGSQINLTRSSRSPSMLANRYDDNYGGVLKDKSTGEQFVFKKDKDSITVYKLYGGDKVDLSSERTMSIEQAEAKFDLKPGWIQKTSKSEITPSKAFDITPNKAFNIKENNMKITKGYLKQVIMEELNKTLKESDFGRGYRPDAFEYFAHHFRHAIQTGSSGAQAVRHAEEGAKREDNKLKNSPTGGPIYGSNMSQDQINKLVAMSNGKVKPEDFSRESSAALTKKEQDAEMERWRNS